MRKELAAIQVLVVELVYFSDKGLLKLAEDLKRGGMLDTNSWAFCPLSYRRGHRGSVSRDSLERSRNAFTEWWDSGFMWKRVGHKSRLVLSYVEKEIQKRGPHLSYVLKK
jgi:hypothetical protein